MLETAAISSSIRFSSCQPHAYVSSRSISAPRNERDSGDVGLATDPVTVAAAGQEFCGDELTASGERLVR